MKTIIHTPKKIVVIFLLAFTVFTFRPFMLLAQDTPEDTCGPDPWDGCPLDSEVMILVATGLACGAIRLYQKKAF